MGEFEKVRRTGGLEAALHFACYRSFELHACKTSYERDWHSDGVFVMGFYFVVLSCKLSFIGRQTHTQCSKRWMKEWNDTIPVYTYMPDDPGED